MCKPRRPDRRTRKRDLLDHGKPKATRSPHRKPSVLLHNTTPPNGESPAAIGVLRVCSHFSTEKSFYSVRSSGILCSAALGLPSHLIPSNYINSVSGQVRVAPSRWIRLPSHLERENKDFFSLETQGKLAGSQEHFHEEVINWADPSGPLACESVTSLSINVTIHQWSLDFLLLTGCLMISTMQSQICDPQLSAWQWPMCYHMRPWDLSHCNALYRKHPQSHVLTLLLNVYFICMCYAWWMPVHHLNTWSLWRPEEITECPGAGVTDLPANIRVQGIKS